MPREKNLEVAPSICNPPLSPNIDHKVEIKLLVLPGTRWDTYGINKKHVSWFKLTRIDDHSDFLKRIYQTDNTEKVKNVKKTETSHTLRLKKAHEKKTFIAIQMTLPKTKEKINIKKLIIDQAINLARSGSIIFTKSIIPVKNAIGIIDSFLSQQL